LPWIFEELWQVEQPPDKQPAKSPGVLSRFRMADAFLAGAVVGMAVSLPLHLDIPLRLVNRYEAPMSVLLGSSSAIVHLYIPLFFIAIGAMFLLFRRTRPLAAAAFAALLWVFLAYSTAVGFAVLHVLNSAFVLFLCPAALVLAVVAAWRRWTPAAMTVATIGVALGAGLAAICVFLDVEVGHEGSPGDPLVWFSVPAAAFTAASLLARRKLAGSGGSRKALFARWWALLSACLMFCTGVLVVTLPRRGVTAPDPAGSRFLGDYAYDLVLWGDPPDLVWTDKRRFHLLKDVYGKARERYDSEGEGTQYEQIWPSQLGGIYIQGPGLVWLDPSTAGEDGKQLKGRTLEVPDDVFDGWTQALVEDVRNRRVILGSEFGSKIAALSLDSGAVLEMKRFSKTQYSSPGAVSNPATRRAYLVQWLYPGTIYELNIDTLRFMRRRPYVNAWGGTIDSARNVMWLARPVMGDVAEFDLEKFDIRRRFPVRFMVRELAMDPSGRNLYTCSWAFGDVYRIDAQNGEVSRLGRCGRICRGVFLDSARGVLWTASNDGICRFAVQGDGKPPVAPS
jgi:hypothetical protein